MEFSFIHSEISAQISQVSPESHGARLKSHGVHLKSHGVRLNLMGFSEMSQVSSESHRVHLNFNKFCLNCLGFIWNEKTTRKHSKVKNISRSDSSLAWKIKHLSQTSPLWSHLCTLDQTPSGFKTGIIYWSIRDQYGP